MKTRTLLSLFLIMAAGGGGPLRAEVPRTLAHQGRIAVEGVNFTGTGHFKFQLYHATAPLDPAQAVATISGGQVTDITVVHGGSGYQAAPAVLLSAPTGPLKQTTATATTAIQDGRVTAITVIEGGSGYILPPQVEVALPAGVISPSVWSNSVALALPGSLSQPPAAVPVPVENGLYAVALGDSSLTNMLALPPDLTPPPGMKLFLRVWFKSSGQNQVSEELLPHQAIESVPFAMHSGTAHTLAGGKVVINEDGDISGIRHLHSGTGSFTGTLSTNNGLSVAGSAVVAGNVILGGTVNVPNDVTVRTLTITGGADLAEPFDLVDPTLEPGTVVVIDEATPGRLRESTRAYDTRVAGVISGAGGIRPGLSLEQEGVNSGGRQVALTGRVYVTADADAAPIAPGDLLTTATTPGHAMKAGDATRAPSAILGKAMSRLDSGRGLVLVLVTLH